MNPEKKWSKDQIRNTINYLRHIPDVNADDLFGARKEMNPEIPKYNGTKVIIERPLERSKSPNSNVVQNLEALIALGSSVLVGVVSATDSEGNTFRYLSLYSGNPNSTRAQFVATINNDEELLIGRDMFARKGDEDEFQTISAEHLTLKFDQSNILTVVDRDSTNGTTVYTAASNSSKDMPFDSKDIRSWAIETSIVDKQLQTTSEEMAVLRGSLGKFTLEEL